MKLKIKKRNFLKNKKIKEIKKELGNYGEIIPKKSQVELVKIEELPDILLIDGKPLLMQTDDKIIPTLKATLNLEITEKYAVVDMGAINFVIKGADIMSPGIVDADKTIVPGDTIIIIDETHKKPLAIGTSMITGQEMIENNKGKAIKNLHYVGDPIWELEI
ncbi:RNA-binding protein [Methanosphaera sp. WGK6]|uniref:RNA-binding protein n=1 Tax=Methanosphaera sp. WGK6 TaxID=1561964 RepID=UPI000A0783F3|nr:RNA-binding protein [Methanosphaera sp. WGK6]